MSKAFRSPKTSDTRTSHSLCKRTYLVHSQYVIIHCQLFTVNIASHQVVKRPYCANTQQQVTFKGMFI